MLAKRITMTFINGQQHKIQPWRINTEGVERLNRITSNTNTNKRTLDDHISSMILTYQLTIERWGHIIYNKCCGALIYIVMPVEHSNHRLMKKPLYRVYGHFISEWNDTMFSDGVYLSLKSSTG